MGATEDAAMRRFPVAAHQRSGLRQEPDVQARAEFRPTI
jgi:hypothetical protein